MFSIHSVAGRIILGMVTGIVIGAITIAFLPWFGFPLFSAFGLGSLVMFFLMGAMIGLIGIFDRHPVFKFKMRWWLRGPALGLLFMLMYVLLSYQNLQFVMQSPLVNWTGLSSPFWALLDGLWIGGLMGWIETSVAGEGSDLSLE